MQQAIRLLEQHAATIGGVRDGQIQVLEVSTHIGRPGKVDERWVWIDATVPAARAWLGY